MNFSGQALLVTLLWVLTTARKQLDHVHSLGERSGLEMSYRDYCNGPESGELAVTETEERRGHRTEPGTLQCLEVREMRKSLQGR